MSSLSLILIFASSIINSFADSGQFPAAEENISWFPPSKSVSTCKLGLKLTSNLLSQDHMDALPTSDDWSYVVDGFAPEVYLQVLSATTSYPLLPHQRRWR